MTTVLEARNLSAGYNGHAVVHELDLKVNAGEVVILLGPNGAGKTTTILTLAGELKPVSGQVWMHGSPTAAPLHRRARRGLSLVTEERSVFMEQTVRENLRVARCEISEALQLFPELEPLLKRRGGLLSGGEQQMLSLARALSRNPSVLLVDELSLGLAPLVVKRLLSAVRRVADERQIGVLLVEQHVRQVLAMADRGYVMRGGHIVMHGNASELGARMRALEDSYMGA